MPERDWIIGEPLRSLQDAIHAWARAKGWWEEPDRNVGELLALAHSELSEALEEYRAGRPLAQIRYRNDGKPEGFPIELADCVIRILDTCAALKIDLDTALCIKMLFNETREHRHGGKKA